MFKPGQKVVCVKTPKAIDFYRQELEVDKVYTWRGPYIYDREYGYLEEVVNPQGCGPEAPYEATNFREVQEDALDIEQLMMEVSKIPVKKLKRESELVN